MIFDTLANSHTYPLGPQWRTIFDFISQLDENTPEGRFEIPGTQAYGFVDSYDTKIPSPDSTLETHIEKIDIQTVLVGEEGFRWYEPSALKVKTPYNSDKDATFYYPPETPAPIQFSIKPGQFAILFPQDAHMPKVSPDSRCASVKKVVVKVPVDALINSA